MCLSFTVVVIGPFRVVLFEAQQKAGVRALLRLATSYPRRSFDFSNFKSPLHSMSLKIFRRDVNVSHEENELA